MSHRRSHVLRAIAPVAVLALALTGCGSDDSDSSSDSKGDTSQSESSDDKNADENDSTDDSADEDAGPGGELKLGESGEQTSKKGDGEATLKITAEKVDKGVNADLVDAGFDSEKVKGKYPVHAYLKYEVTELSGEIEPGTDFNTTAAVLDTEGKPGSRFIAIGGEPLKGGCPEKDRELKWEKGTTATQCTTYLMPEGKEIDKVAWGMVNPLMWAID